jgi:hypothetical protein
MSKKCVNNQSTPVRNQQNSSVRTSPPFGQSLTEQRVKEIVIESLIALGLVPQPQKRKTIHA